MKLKLSVVAIAAPIASLVLVTVTSFPSYAASRLDGCDPSASENQSVIGSTWKSKCLNASVNSVWEDICNDMTLAQARKTSSKNGCWKLMSRLEYAKTK
jgi:hypothetical protein